MSFGGLQQVLEQAAEVRLAVVFGSAARGVANAQSDIDIGISLAAEADAGSLSRLRVELERAAGRAVDLVVLDEAPPLLRFEIARAGTVLVQRDPHGWADFRARALIDWWDWAPTARMMHETMTTRLADEAGRGAS